MNKKEMEARANAVKELSKQMVAETKKPYNFSGVKIVNDIPNGSYRAYIIDMTLTKQYATLRLYMKPLLETNPKPIRLTYCIGFGDNKYTRNQTSNIMVQLNKVDKEYKEALENFWNDYPALINDGIAEEGLTFTEAKMRVLDKMPRWYVQGKYEDLGTVLCTATHYQSRLNLDFNASKIRQKLKNANMKGGVK